MKANTINHRCAASCAESIADINVRQNDEQKTISIFGERSQTHSTVVNLRTRVKNISQLCPGHEKGEKYVRNSNHLHHLIQSCMQSRWTLVAETLSSFESFDSPNPRLLVGACATHETRFYSHRDEPSATDGELEICKKRVCGRIKSLRVISDCELPEPDSLVTMNVECYVEHMIVSFWSLCKWNSAFVFLARVITWGVNGSQKGGGTTERKNSEHFWLYHLFVCLIDSNHLWNANW